MRLYKVWYRDDDGIHREAIIPAPNAALAKAGMGDRAYWVLRNERPTRTKIV